MSDSKGPWGVRGVSEADQQEVTAAAKRRRVTIGVWLTDAIHRELTAEREPLAVRVEPEPGQLQPLYNAPSPAPNPYQEAAYLAALLPAVATPSGRSAAEIALRKAIIEDVERIRSTRRTTGEQHVLPAS